MEILMDIKNYFKNLYFHELGNLEEMEKCLRKYELPKIGPKYIKAINRSIKGNKNWGSNKNKEQCRTWCIHYTILIKLQRNILKCSVTCSFLWTSGSWACLSAFSSSDPFLLYTVSKSSVYTLLGHKKPCLDLLKWYNHPEFSDFELTWPKTVSLGGVNTLILHMKTEIHENVRGQKSWLPKETELSLDSIFYFIWVLAECIAS